MFVELRATERPTERDGVVNEVQCVLGDVEDPLSSGRRDVGGVHTPLGWNRPIEHLGSGGQLYAFKRDELGQDVEGRTQSVARDAP